MIVLGESATYLCSPFSESVLVSERSSKVIRATRLAWVIRGQTSTRYCITAGVSVAVSCSDTASVVKPSRNFKLRYHYDRHWRMLQRSS